MRGNKRIVVIEDEPSVQKIARLYLERDGYEVLSAGTGAEGLALSERSSPDMIVLDLMLPDVPGEEICDEIRSRSDVPILMLTAKAGEEDRLAGLAAGADDYLVKPFSPRELVARVRAVLRRARGAGVPLVDKIRLAGGRLEIDTVGHVVTVNGAIVHLTPSEYKLLVALAAHPGRVYSRYDLIDAVQGDDFDGYERIVDAHVKNLRRKIEPDPAHPRYIQTVLGEGYRVPRL